MALIEESFQGWTGGLVGVGIGLVAPALFPILGTATRFLAKEGIKTYFAVADAMKGAVTETSAKPSNQAVRAQDKRDATAVSSKTRARTRSKNKSQAKVR
jgi:hypothetical protein